MPLISLIVVIIVFALVWYLVTLLPDPPIGAPFRQIIQIILILVLILWLLGLVGVIPIGTLRLQ